MIPQTLSATVQHSASWVNWHPEFVHPILYSSFETSHNSHRNTFPHLSKRPKSPTANIMLLSRCNKHATVQHSASWVNWHPEFVHPILYSSFETSHNSHRNTFPHLSKRPKSPTANIMLLSRCNKHGDCDSNKSRNRCNNLSSLLSLRLFTAQHALGVLTPIIRSSTTVVAASGFTFGA